MKAPAGAHSQLGLCPHFSKGFVVQCLPSQLQLPKLVATPAPDPFAEYGERPLALVPPLGQ